MCDPPRLLGDEELALRAQAGCAQSFEELVRRYQVPTLHFLQRLGAGGEAEDLLQETFVRAYRNLGQYRPKWRFVTWLFTIARRVRLNHQRRQIPEARGEAVEGMASPGPGPPELAAAAEDRQRLWDLAARILSHEECSALWLFYVEEMSAREIAAVLERSWVSIKTMLFRARRRMLEFLADRQDPHPLQSGCAGTERASRVSRPEVPHVPT